MTILPMTNKFRILDSGLPCIVLPGYTSSIGRAISSLFLSSGCFAVLGLSRKPSNQYFESNYPDAFCHVTVTSEFYFDSQAIESLFLSLPSLSGLVYLPSHSSLSACHRLKRSDFYSAFDLNVISPFMFALAFKKAVAVNDAAKRASIVFLSSVAAVRPSRGQLLYSVSKASLTALVLNLALEFAPVNIRVNGIIAGYIESEASDRLQSLVGANGIASILSRYPLSKGLPSDLASLVYFLINSDSSWMTGSNILLDGGFTLT